MVRDWRVNQAKCPGYYGDFPSPEQPRFLNTLKSFGWYRPKEYNSGLLGKVTKATNKRTAEAIRLAWPLWRDGPRNPSDVEDVQVIMYWLEKFRGCPITKGMSYWHEFYVRRIQELLSEHDKAVHRRV